MGMVWTMKYQPLPWEDNSLKIPVRHVSNPNYLNLAGSIHIATNQVVSGRYRQGIKNLAHDFVTS
jgi:hypothetical protein